MICGITHDEAADSTCQFAELSSLLGPTVAKVSSRLDE
jgi:hypothetical protein